MVSAAIMIGPTTRSTWAITAAAQVNSGARRHASPGARSRRTVTIMLTAQQTNPRQASATPAIQASAPFEGEKAVSESGGSAAVPVSGAL